MRRLVRLRTLMLTIAILAALLAAGTGWRRQIYLKQAAYHARLQETFERAVLGQDDFAKGVINNRYFVISDYDKSSSLYNFHGFENNRNIAQLAQAQLARSIRRRDYHFQMRAKYLQAAATPWMPVSPDPPPPP